MASAEAAWTPFGQLEWAGLFTEQAAKAEKKKKMQDLIREAAIEHRMLQFGKKQKPTPNTLEEKLGKACACHQTLPEGSHKEGCYNVSQNVKSETES